MNGSRGAVSRAARLSHHAPDFLESQLPPEANHRAQTQQNQSDWEFRANRSLRTIETSKPGDDEVTKEYEAANRRLRSLFEKGWKADDRLLIRCYWEFTKRLVHHHRAES